NGELLNTVPKAINWAATMTWKGIEPTVKLINQIYEKGVKLTKKEIKKYEDRIERSKKLSKWDVTIEPALG
ncbi:MAG: ISAzo13 family transposase, partial [Thermodesulfobacteriota bacterium]|nr:ISAzo13 family transposase [Thermodesulfobacteriota bacterium]